jgi:hypothetical protein
MIKVVWGAGARLAAALSLVAFTLASASCGQLTRQGTASSYLIVSALEASSGADPGGFGGTLDSDVITIVEEVPTIFSDLGRVTFTLGMKDPGGAGSPTAPTQANWITVERYHVAYVRADGRNTQGVDVPYAFDGAATATVAGGDTTIGFTIVRHQAKEEAPLAALGNGAVLISTIAEVTFYGHDQTGREVSASGKIGISFGNYGDPK